MNKARTASYAGNDRLFAILFAFLLAAMGLAFVATPAKATETNPPISSTCLDGWYVNSDETDRMPKTGEEGLTFVGNDLVHHAASMPLADLETGTYIATPPPSLDSFFSVEIINGDGSGYATLRLDSNGWFIGGPKAGTYDGHETNPANFVGKMSNWGVIKTDSTVISFGVGYTQNPSDGTETLVVTVGFGGHSYDMKCVKETSPSPSVSPSASASESSSAITPATVRPASTEDAALPVTGSGISVIFVVGLILVLGGVAALIVLRLLRR